MESRIRLLQKNRSSIRNICILAHVDHGKTTLADSLVASNGIISQRQAGKVRYMDSREDEQLKGITMKSSAIALQHNQSGENYLVNLIDSPGHVDFSSEVSAAVRLCDGALVVVDAVEGVCPQTQAVLQQAWDEDIRLCLVINKIDRLITELQQTPAEAYFHLQHILEQVNAVSGSLFSSKVMAAASNEPRARRASSSEETQRTYDWSDGLEDTDDSSLYFSPEQGNVVFASALDGWGFRVSDFASMYSKKLGIKENVLRKTLWGDFYLNMKTKRILKGAQEKTKKPLFVQFVLDNIWSVYKAVVLERDNENIERIVKSLNLKISARDSRHTNSRVHLFAICSQWLPLAGSVMEMVVTHLPSPLQLSEERVDKLMCSNVHNFQSFPQKTQLLKKDFISCGVEDSSPVIVFVSKLFAMDKEALPQHEKRPLTEAEMVERRDMVRQKHRDAPVEASQTTEGHSDSIDTQGCKYVCLQEGCDDDGASNGPIFLAFSRVFSGVLRRGLKLFVLQPRYDPRESDLDEVTALPLHVTEFTVGDLYVFMGRSVVLVDQVPAGNIVGVAGLGESVIKSATLSSTLSCPSFGAMQLVAAPILRVAIEPQHASDLPALVKGMKLLNQADPSVEVSVQETGEHILAATGEVHLNKCLNDMRTQYARVELQVSAPIIPFRETIVPPPKMDMVNEEISSENEVMLFHKTPSDVPTPLSVGDDGLGYKPFLDDGGGGVIAIQTASKSCTLILEARPLPMECCTLLDKNTHLLKALNLVQTSSNRRMVLKKDILVELMDFRTKLNSALLASPSFSKGSVDSIWSFGPRYTGPNILLNEVRDYARPSLWEALNSEPRKPLQEFDNSIVSGFQLASLSGPLCEEPMHGVCFILKDWKQTSSSEDDSGPAQINCGPLSGQLISAMKEGCRRAFLTKPARIMAAMYTSTILASAEVLGKVYGILGRRNGKVLSDEMREGTDIFNIQALLPVAESLGFAKEIRKGTSGLASPHLVFSHWEVIPSDPFWVPSTEEELLHFGEKADSDNIAKRYMNDVRKRKGLHLDEKIVEHGAKQRTLKKNK